MRRRTRELALASTLAAPAVVEELASTAPAPLLATAALGAAVFLVCDLAPERLTTLHKRRRTRR